MSLEREMLPDRPEAREEFLRAFGSRKPRMRRSRSRVGWWLFSARLFNRTAALPNTCFTFAISGRISATQICHLAFSANPGVKWGEI